MKSFISLSITSVLVKSYMLVSFVWLSYHKSVQFIKMTAEKRAAAMHTNAVG